MKVRAFVLLACVLLPVSAVADQDMLNEEWVLPSGGGAHSLSFTLPAAAPVLVEMTPVKHADKGVTLRIVPAEDIDACTGKSQGACRSRPGFDGFKIRSFSHTETIPAGRWTFYAANTENLMFSATVHVHVVANPSN
jgi:hypothetical protein